MTEPIYQCVPAQDLTGHQIYQRMRVNVPGPGSLDDAANAASKVHQSLHTAEKALRDYQSALQAGVRGDAGDAAHQASQPLVKSVTDAQQKVHTFGKTSGAQADQFRNNSRPLHDIAAQPPDAGFLDRAKTGWGLWGDDPADKLDDYQQKDAANKREFYHYTDASSGHSGELPGKASYKGHTLDNLTIYDPRRTGGSGGYSGGGYPTGGGAGNGSAGGGYPGGPGGGGVTGPHIGGGGGGAGVGVGTGGASTGPGTGSDLLGPGTTSTAGYTGPAAGPVGSGGFGPGGPGMGAGSGSGPGAGGFTPGGMAGAGGFGAGGAGGAGAGRGAGSLGSGGRSAAAAAEEAAAGRGAARAGAAGAAGAPGRPGMGMGRGRGGRGEEDKEHSSASYLVDEDNGNAIVGDLPLTAPPVIGG